MLVLKKICGCYQDSVIPRMELASLPSQCIRAEQKNELNALESIGIQHFGVQLARHTVTGDQFAAMETATIVHLPAFLEIF